MNLTRRTLLGALAASPLALHAQTAWPAGRPINMVVGYAPGGSVDLACRATADYLAAKLPGAIVTVENVSGAAGVIAAQRVSQAPADGYTLMVGSSNEFCATAHVNPAQKYDPVKGFTHIGMVCDSPVLFVASPKLGVRNMDEFLALVRKHPGKYSYGSSGVGSTLHFAGELLKKRGNLFMSHIPYRGTAPLLTDLVGGNLDFAMITTTAANSFVANGRLVALGVTSAKRSPAAPNVPAIAEHPALSGYELTGWLSLAAPRGLTEEIAERLRIALRARLQDPAYRRRLEDGGLVPATGNEDISAVIQQDGKKYAELVKFANIKD
ncbi:Bug family tripartite tricarboxylate transporter substrate binding protein [Comamonas endophytica]|uniref:Tripartite tricarboxylate transporter substrate binding protein n=1 Tax=Comamonas endophytica TaxID=2949090 RepID=A0ABY6G8Z6_9BURK|nr:MULTISPECIES: tripartite tricarboxylate transporter substrate binding protein [unclassified Acidovorax]MCD2511784.1 tripartite tricarboxylate transporter substrate binding protein [Acidovorax sp. D4N7]UYG51508.1 tripartite tricarboxylate transporter substrate binding protein [Acidovorax sp. 5MLIR]